MKLLFKDLTLAAHPTMYIFTLLGCLVIVPSYPMTVVFMFSCIAQYITFTYSRETNDNFFTAVLPGKKGGNCKVPVSFGRSCPRRRRWS